MNLPQALSLFLLAACLVVAVWRKVNIGVLALASALVVLVVSGAKSADVKEMYEGFPGNLFALIVGVSLLFAHLEKSGALAGFVDWVFRRIGRRTYLLPWACFLIAGALTSMGCFSTAPIALLVPAVAFVCARNPRQFFVNEMATIIAANAAGLSPLNPTGATVVTAMKKAGVTYNPWMVWAISVLCALLAVIAIQVVERFNDRRGVQPLLPLAVEDAAPVAINKPYAIASGLVLLGFVLAIVFLGWDIGVTSFAGALILQLAFRPNEKEIIHRVPWNAVLLLCGLLTYLGLIQQIGTMQVLQKSLNGLSGVVLVFVLAYLTALLCNIESSTIGVLTLMAPVVAAALGSNPAITLIIAAVAAPAALTVMNPVHVAGTLVVANTLEEQQPRAFGRLFTTSVALSAIAPGILAAIAAVAMR